MCFVVINLSFVKSKKEILISSMCSNLFSCVHVNVLSYHTRLEHSSIFQGVSLWGVAFKDVCQTEQLMYRVGGLSLVSNQSTRNYESVYYKPVKTKEQLLMRMFSCSDLICTKSNSLNEIC